MFFQPTTPREVEEQCRLLVPCKGAGWDEVSPGIIRMVAREISTPLSRLYNLCMREGYYPSFFKVARVVPIFKEGDPTEFGNYRPVCPPGALSGIRANPEGPVGPVF